VRYAFQLMVAIGLLLGLVTFGYWLARWKRPRLLDGPRWPLLLIAACGPLAFLCVEAGWVVTEVGRQPWIVYGYRRVSASLTDSPLVGLMFVVFTVLYVLLSAVTIVALRSELAILPRSARHETTAH
jgi:cytochrome d ubiquinol oxidase subunit I